MSATDWKKLEQVWRISLEKDSSGFWSATVDGVDGASSTEATPEDAAYNAVKLARELDPRRFD